MSEILQRSLGASRGKPLSERATAPTCSSSLTHTGSREWEAHCHTAEKENPQTRTARGSLGTSQHAALSSLLSSVEIPNWSWRKRQALGFCPLRGMIMRIQFQIGHADPCWMFPSRPSWLLNEVNPAQPSEIFEANTQESC